MARFRSPLISRRTRRSGRGRSRMMTWWVLWRVPALVAIVAALWWYGVRPIAHEQGWVRVDDSFAVCGAGSTRAAGCVVDGDTVIMGFGPERRRIRFTGFDAPEMDGACPAERESCHFRAHRAGAMAGTRRIRMEWRGRPSPRSIRARTARGAPHRPRTLQRLPRRDHDRTRPRQRKRLGRGRSRLVCVTRQLTHSRPPHNAHQ